MNYDEAYEGAYVVYPDYVHKIDRRIADRPAFLDPPVVGILQRILRDGGGQPRIARVYFPGIGVRECGIDCLAHAEHWFIEHGDASARWAQEKMAREQAA